MTEKNMKDAKNIFSLQRAHKMRLTTHSSIPEQRQSALAVGNYILYAR